MKRKAIVDLDVCDDGITCGILCIGLDPGKIGQCYAFRTVRKNPRKLRPAKGGGCLRCEACLRAEIACDNFLVIWPQWFYRKDLYANNSRDIRKKSRKPKEEK